MPAATSATRSESQSARPTPTVVSAPARAPAPGVLSSKPLLSAAPALSPAPILVAPPRITLSLSPPTPAAATPPAAIPPASPPPPASTPPPASPSSGAAPSGSPLLPEVRRPLEKSFSTDLRAVRVHTDSGAQTVAHSLSTRAVTYGNDIFLGPGERPTDMRVMAHEAAHVVQQRGGGATAQPFSPGNDSAHEAEAEQASAAVQRGESFTVQQQTSPRPQGLLGIDLPDPLDWLANKANVIPGFRMFTIILGVNPINMSPVARSAANILRALIEFLPGGGLITQALDNAGVFEKAGAFVEKQIATLGMTGSAIKTAVTSFIGGLSLRRIITSPGSVWSDAKRIFTDPIDRIKAFGVGLVTGIIEIIKDAILKPIAKMAEGTEGYNLLKGVLGKDPITDEPVTRSAETLLGPLLKMIGLGDVWQKMQDAKAIPRAWAWFQSTMGQLLAIVSAIPGAFIGAFKSLTLEDIILIPKAFIKLGKVFVGFIAKFISWGVDAMWELLKIVFDVVSPGAWGYIQKTGAALKSILKNPLPFVGNLVKAAKLGFTNFAGNFGKHLKAGLLDWLLGSLPGIYIPRSFALGEIVKFIFSVLGLTWVNLRAKLVRAVGETAVRAMETGFDIVKTLVTQGPAAAWDKIQAQLTALKDQVVSGIIEMVVGLIVTRAVPKLIAMFIPGAGFISAIISIYGTVMVFINKISRIIQVVTGFINSIVAIAAGNIGAAASKVESVLAGLLVLAINFLMAFAGLGRVADKVMGVVNKIRTPIDRAMEAVVTWIVAAARRLGRFLVGKARSAAARVLQWWRARKSFRGGDGATHALYFTGQGASAVLTVASGTPAPVTNFLRNIAAAAAASTDPAVRAAHQAATAKARVIDRLRATVEAKGATGRQTADVDLLNSEMEALANLLPPLVALAYPPVAAAPGAAPVATRELIKLTSSNLVALVTAIEPGPAPGTLMVKFRVVSPRHERRTANLPTGYLATTFGREFTKHTADPRELYLTPTPGKASDTGEKVKKRMKEEGKIVNNKVRYARDGTEVDVANCDMGHIIDAVTWWNSNGRLTGAQSPTVRQFMENPINYEFEPSGPNQARGAAMAARGVRYLPPAV